MCFYTIISKFLTSVNFGKEGTCMHHEKLCKEVIPCDLLFYVHVSGNIRGTLIFAYFAQIQQAQIQKPAKIFAGTQNSFQNDKWA